MSLSAFVRLAENASGFPLRLNVPSSSLSILHVVLHMEAGYACIDSVSQPGLRTVCPDQVVQVGACGASGSLVLSDVLILTFFLGGLPSGRGSLGSS